MGKKDQKKQPEEVIEAGAQVANKNSTKAKTAVAPSKAPVNQKPAIAKNAEPSDSEENDSDEEEVVTIGKRKAQALTTGEKKVQPDAKKAKPVAKIPEKTAADSDNSGSEEEVDEEEEEVKQERSPQKGQTNEGDKTEIYVANLSYETTEDDLSQHFGQFGEVVKVKLLKNHDGRSKGTAFIDFDSSDAASKALAVNGEDYMGRQLRINYSGDKAQGGRDGDRQGSYGASPQNFNGGSRNDAATVFVGNLPFKATIENIKEFFSEVGEVKDVRLAKDETGRLKGFGHVEFASESVIDQALNLNGKELEGRELKVDRANSKGGFSGGRGGFGGGRGRGGFGGDRGRGGFGGGRGRGGFGGDRGRGGFGGGRGRGGFRGGDRF